jgi:hypothetical protein
MGASPSPWAGFGGTGGLFAGPFAPRWQCGRCDTPLENLLRNCDSSIDYLGHAKFADHAGFAKEQGFVDRSKKYGHATHFVSHGPGWLAGAPAPRLRVTFCSHSSGDRGLLPCHHRGGPGWVRSQAPQSRRT